MYFKKIVMISIGLCLTTNLLATSSSQRPTLVMVHGALLTSSIWGSVQSFLQTHHYNVVTLDVPGRANDEISAKDADLYLAAKKVCNVVDMQQGPVILVGHSQGGAVLNQALADCSNKVKALIYIAAVVPLNGEKPYDMLSETDGDHFDQCTYLDTKNGLAQINYNGPVKDMFMDDVNEASSRQAIYNMVPEPLIIGDNQLHFSTEIFNAIPKFYIATTADKIISRDTQTKIINHVTFNKVYELNSSHSPFLSQPKQLGVVLSEIVDSLVR